MAWHHHSPWIWIRATNVSILSILGPLTHFPEIHPTHNFPVLTWVGSGSISARLLPSWMGTGCISLPLIMAKSHGCKFFKCTMWTHCLGTFPKVLESIGYPTLPSTQLDPEEFGEEVGHCHCTGYFPGDFQCSRGPRNTLTGTEQDWFQWKWPPWGGKPGETEELATRGKEDGKAEEVCPCPAQ